jgi:magnesium transporter
MIQLFSNQNRQFAPVVSLKGFSLPVDVTWIDLFEPTPEEEKILEAELKLDLPTREELKDIEPSSRLYNENGAAYMTASIVWKADVNEPEITPIAFILTSSRLITIRYAEPRPFTAFVAYAAKNPEICSSPTMILAGLLEAISDRLAEILERTGSDIELMLKRVFARKKRRDKPMANRNLESILSEIAGHQNMTSVSRDSLISLARMVGFLSAVQHAQTPEFSDRIKSIAKDIQFLTDHVGLLSSNITFMLEASLGLVNIEQNQIIKIFSVAAVVFLPPTLVASIYGMNFAAMPELHWHLGYPLALALMVISAVLPYLWFKKKGWL